MSRRWLLVALAGTAAGCAGPAGVRLTMTEQIGEEAETTGAVEMAATRYQQRLNKDGTMPENGLWLAKLRRDQMVRELPPSPGRDGGWTWIGPGNVGGRLRSILINPVDPNVLYVGSAGGGVWKSTNAGASWAALPDFVPSLAIGCMVFAPNDPNTIYVGTGEGCFETVSGTSNSAAPLGAGIFKSTDAGTNWTQIPSTAGSDWHFVNRLAFQPGTTTVMLAATESGIWRSTDAGDTWTSRTTGRTLDVEFDPTNASRAVAGRGDGIAQYSTDGGVTWQNATGIPATSKRVELTYAPSNTAIVYAGVSAGSGSTTMRVYRSTDAGLTYVQMTGTGVGTLSSYTGVLWVDPLNPATLLLGTQAMRRSTNNGTTLSTTFNGLHADHHFIAQHPQYNGTTNKILYFATDGGVYRTTDSAGSAVTNLNNNMGVTQFYGAAINDASGVVVAGAQDNGTNRFTGNAQGWTLNVLGGDGGFCASDPTDPNYFYAEFQRLTIHRSSNGGASFSAIYNGISENSTLNVNFIPYFLLDPNNPNRMLGAGRNLWRSNNVKTGNPVTWASIKAPLLLAPEPPSRHRVPRQDHYSPNDPRNIATMTVAQGNSDIIWVGHNNGQLYKSTNGTAAAPTWSRVDTNAPSWPGRWISRIVIDPANHSRVYVSFLGYASDNVWRTTDAGLTWQPIPGSGPGMLPAVPVGGLAQHRLDPARLFAGTEVGMFMSTNDGASWAPIAPEVGLVEIQELVWRNNTTLMAVTFGRGVYLGDVGVAPCYADCDQNSSLNVNDFICFQSAFAAGQPYADCDLNSLLNVNDFICFQSAFAAGCP